MARPAEVVTRAVQGSKERTGVSCRRERLLRRDLTRTARATRWDEMTFCFTRVNSAWTPEPVAQDSLHEHFKKMLEIWSLERE